MGFSRFFGPQLERAARTPGEVHLLELRPHQPMIDWPTNDGHSGADHRHPWIDPVFNGNSMDDKSTGKTASQEVNALLSGYQWAGKSVSYSNPDSPSDYPSYYDNDGDGDGKSVQHDGFSKLDAKQKIAMHFALDTKDYGQGRSAAGFSVEGMTNLNITYAGDGKGNGTIRLANMKDYDGAYAFYPDRGPYGGDAWFGPDAKNATPGGWNWYVILTNWVIPSG
jgi:serralysin